MAGRPVFGSSLRPQPGRPSGKVPTVKPAGSARPTGAAKSEYRPGTRVQHAIFGPGTVLDVQGTGAKQKVKINFRNAGEKTLMVQYANLKVVG